MKLYQQTIYETCLAICLMYLINIKPDKKKEIEIWQRGWFFNYLVGQVKYVEKKYHHKFKLIIEVKKYYSLLKLNNASCQKICLKLIRQTKKPAVLYLDNYYLAGVLHAPHFVVLVAMTDKNARVFDPLDGNQKNIPIKKLIRGISSLRNKLKYSPVLIYKE